MKIKIYPKNRIGRITVICTALFLICYLFSITIVGMSQTKANSEIVIDPFFQPILGLFGITAVISGIAAFIGGLVSVIKHKERNLLVLISFGLGVLVVLFVLSEFLMPH